MKKIIITVGLAIACLSVYCAELQTVTIAEGATTGTWTSTSKSVLNLKSAFGTLGGVAAGAETVTVSVEEDDVDYVVDSGTITSNLTSLIIDIDVDASVSPSEIVTFTRTAATTNEALNIILVIE